MKTRILKMLFLAVWAEPVFADNFEGKIEGVESNEIIVYKYDFESRKALSPDTILLTDGSFSITIPDKLMRMTVVPKPKKNEVKRNSVNTFIFMPGDHLILNGNISKLVPSGTVLYQELATCKEVNDLQQKADSLMGVLSVLYQDKEKNNDVILRSKQDLKSLFAELSQARKAAVLRNPSQVSSVYHITRMPVADAVERMKLLPAEVRNGVMKPMLDQVEYNYEVTMKRNNAMKLLTAGAPAPDFQLIDLEYKIRSLADFKGKYVVLDFWGTWCGWCIKGMPKMKEYYQKYKDKMEIVGICCNDTEEKWKQGVAKHQLPWTNLFNGFEKDILTKYAVTGYPTKVLIDPDGKLVQIFVGESEELYQKLDKLFTNQ